jgi:hypothetical protein
VRLTNQSFAGSLRSHRTKRNVNIVLRFYKFDADVCHCTRSASAAKQRDQKDQMLQQAVLHPGNLNREGKQNKSNSRAKRRAVGRNPRSWACLLKSGRRRKLRLLYRRESVVLLRKSAALLDGGDIISLSLRKSPHSTFPFGLTEVHNVGSAQI